MSLLSTRALAVSVGGNGVRGNFDLTIDPGQCWGLLGANGSGKTSLLHTLAGLRKPQQGEVFLGDTALSGLSRRSVARRLGVLLQDAAAPMDGTAYDIALMGRFAQVAFWRTESGQDSEIALAALRTVGLASFAYRELAAMSGGERQRAALAAILAQVPQLFLLDEPTNHLDPAWQIRLMGLLQRICRQEGRAMLAALQDVNVAARFCDHLVLLLADGSTRFGPKEEMLGYLDSVYGYPMRRLHTSEGSYFLPA